MSAAALAILRNRVKNAAPNDGIIVYASDIQALLKAFDEAQAEIAELSALVEPQEADK